MTKTPHRIGLISDTHGVLDLRVAGAFSGVEAIVHAGDVCGDGILYELQALTPCVVAIAGNCDTVPGVWELDPIARATLCGVRLLAVHDLRTLGEIPDDVDVVVHGHTHAPSVERRGGVLLVNPGSASQRRRQPSRSVGLLDVGVDGALEARIVLLDKLAGG